MLRLCLAALAGPLLVAGAVSCHLVVGADDFVVDRSEVGGDGGTSNPGGGGGATTTGSGGQGGTGTTTSTTTDTTTTTSTSTTTTVPCDQRPSCEECMGCSILDTCEGVYTTCMNNTECAAISNCAVNCVDMPCIEACASAHPNGQLQALALYNCVFTEACPNAC